MSAEDPKVIPSPFGPAVITGGYDEATGSFTQIDLRDYDGSQFTVMLNQHGSPCEQHDGSMFWIITLPLPRITPDWIKVLAWVGGFFIATQLADIFMTVFG